MTVTMDDVHRAVCVARDESRIDPCKRPTILWMNEFTWKELVRQMTAAEFLTPKEAIDMEPKFAGVPVRIDPDMPEGCFGIERGEGEMPITIEAVYRGVIEATDAAGGVAPRAVNMHPQTWWGLAVEIEQHGGTSWFMMLAGVPVRLDPDMPLGRFCIRS